MTADSGGMKDALRLVYRMLSVVRAGAVIMLMGMVFGWDLKSMVNPVRCGVGEKKKQCAGDKEMEALPPIGNCARQ